MSTATITAPDRTLPASVESLVERARAAGRVSDEQLAAACAKATADPAEAGDLAEHVTDLLTADGVDVVVGDEPAGRASAGASLGEHPLLSASEELRLAQMIERGDLQAKDRLVRCNTRLVISIARRYRNLGLDFDDLVQEGTIGLIRAAEKFDARRGNRFSTYAGRWIRQSIMRALENKAQQIRQPAEVQQQIRRVRDARTRLEAAGARCPSPHDVAAQANRGHKTPIDADRVLELDRLDREQGVTVSIDRPAGEDSDTTVGDMIVSVAPAPEDEVAEREAQVKVAEALEGLPDRERKIIRMRFGIDGGKEHTLQQIADDLGISKQRVRQLEGRALLWLGSVKSLHPVDMDS